MAEDIVRKGVGGGLGGCEGDGDDEESKAFSQFSTVKGERH